MSPEVFISKVQDQAMRSASQTGIPASFSIAEGALESGWGESQLFREANNLFGVKKYPAWTGGVLPMITREFILGRPVMQQALWCKYADLTDCFNDHARFFYENPRYHQALDKLPDVVEFTRGIAAAGYSTDPHYADKILSIIETHNLTKFDKGDNDGHQT